MVYGAEEQEALDTLKAVWQRYGVFVMVGLLVVLLSVAGWSGWQYWQRKQAVEAAVLYDQAESAAYGKDVAKVLRVAMDIQTKFPRTAYAQLSALAAAKMSFETGDHKAAKEQLQWASQHGISDDLRQLAGLRLATVLLDEKDYDAALVLLKKEVSAGFSALYIERLGDVFLAQNKLGQARAAYQKALEKVDANALAQRQLLNFKLDIVGGA
ncbi:MAG: tetratricopeptide repeat protein [Ottowia sp.]|nr:tetratricopeptide repeat protein [Ottowia sp.]